MIKDLQEKIIQLKKEKDICILAHCYQNPEILEVAGFYRGQFRTFCRGCKDYSQNGYYVWCTFYGGDC